MAPTRKRTRSKKGKTKRRILGGGGKESSISNSRKSRRQIPYTIPEKTSISARSASSALRSNVMSYARPAAMPNNGPKGYDPRPFQRMMNKTSQERRNANPKNYDAKEETRRLNKDDTEARIRAKIVYIANRKIQLQQEVLQEEAKLENLEHTLSALKDVNDPDEKGNWSNIGTNPNTDRRYQKLQDIFAPKRNALAEQAKSIRKIDELKRSIIHNDDVLKELQQKTNRGTPLY